MTTFVRAAQYVRMPDEPHQFSIDSQEVAIQEYADRHHTVIVRTIPMLETRSIVV